MSIQFTKMVQTKSYQHVVEQIQNAIFSDEIKQGDRLPSEMKLKEMFATSRGTIREALRVLEQKGLISIRTGVKGGAVVQEANTDAMSDSMAMLIRHKKISLRDLADFRELLEGHAAEQAAANVNRIQVEELKMLIEKMRALVESQPGDWGEFHRLDAIFHSTVAKMAQNPLLQANLETIHANIRVYFNSFLPFSQQLLEDDFNDLVKIFDAISDGNNIQAGRYARSHISKFSKLMALSQEKVGETAR